MYIAFHLQTQGTRVAPVTRTASLQHLTTASGGESAHFVPRELTPPAGDAAAQSSQGDPGASVPSIPPQSPPPQPSRPLKKLSVGVPPPALPGSAFQSPPAEKPALPSLQAFSASTAAIPASPRSHTASSTASSVSQAPLGQESLGGQGGGDDNPPGAPPPPPSDLALPASPTHATTAGAPGRSRRNRHGPSSSGGGGGGGGSSGRRHRRPGQRDRTSIRSDASKDSLDGGAPASELPSVSQYFQGNVPTSTPRVASGASGTPPGFSRAPLQPARPAAVIDAGVESDDSLVGASSSLHAPPGTADSDRTGHAVAMALAHARVQHAAELNRQRQTLTSQYAATLKATEAALQARVHTLEQRMAEHEATGRVASARTLAVTRDAKFQTRQAREEARSEIASLRQSAEEASTRARRLTSVLARAEADNEKWKAAADEAKAKAEQLAADLEQAKAAVARRPTTPEGPPPPALDISAPPAAGTSRDVKPPSTPAAAPPAAQATAALATAQGEIRALRQQVVTLSAAAAEAESQLQQLQSNTEHASTVDSETEPPDTVETGTAMTPPAPAKQGRQGGSPASEGDEESDTVRRLRAEIARLDMALASAAAASVVGGLSADDMLPRGDTKGFEGPYGKAGGGSPRKAGTTVARAPAAAAPTTSSLAKRTRAAAARDGGGSPSRSRGGSEANSDDEAAPAADSQLSTEAARSALEERLRPEVEAELRVSLSRQLRRELKAAFVPDVKAELRESLREGVRKELTAELREGLEATLARELKPGVVKQLRSDVKQGVKQTLRSELAAEVSDALREELTPGMKADLRAELRDRVVAEIREADLPDLRAAVEADVQAGLTGVAAEAAAAAASKARAGARADVWKQAAFELITALTSVSQAVVRGVRKDGGVTLLQGGGDLDKALSAATGTDESSCSDAVILRLAHEAGAPSPHEGGVRRPTGTSITLALSALLREHTRLVLRAFDRAKPAAAEADLQSPAVLAAIEEKVAEQVAATRTEYERMMRDWEKSTEEWRASTIAACESSLKEARTRVEESEQTATAASARADSSASQVAELRSVAESLRQQLANAQSERPRSRSGGRRGFDSAEGTPSTPTSSPYGMRRSRRTTPKSEHGETENNAGGFSADRAAATAVRQGRSTPVKGPSSPAEGGLSGRRSTSTPVDTKQGEAANAGVGTPGTDGLFGSDAQSSPESATTDSPYFSSTSAAVGAGSSTESKHTPPKGQGTPPGSRVVTPSNSPASLKSAVLGFSVSELRRMLTVAHVPHSDCVEKVELQDRLMRAVQEGLVRGHPDSPEAPQPEKDTPPSRAQAAFAARTGGKSKPPTPSYAPPADLGAGRWRDGPTAPVEEGGEGGAVDGSGAAAVWAAAASPRIPTASRVRGGTWNKVPFKHTSSPQHSTAQAEAPFAQRQTGGEAATHSADRRPGRAAPPVAQAGAPAAADVPVQRQSAAAAAATAAAAVAAADFDFDNLKREVDEAAATAKRGVGGGETARPVYASPPRSEQGGGGEGGPTTPSPLSPGNRTSQSASSTPDSAAGLDSWLPAYTAEGTVYWFHKTTRAVRWERPSKRAAAKMEKRITREEAEVEARKADRLNALAQEQAAAAAAASRRAEVQTDVERRVRAWAHGRSIRALLASLPAALVLCGRQVPPEVVEAGRTRDAAGIKRGYLKAIRLVHPDKMATADIAAQVEAKTVFEVLQGAWVQYTSKGGSGGGSSASRRASTSSAQYYHGGGGTGASRYASASAYYSKGTASRGGAAAYTGASGRFSTGAGDGGGVYAAPGSAWGTAGRRNSAF